MPDTLIVPDSRLDGKSGDVAVMVPIVQMTPLTQGTSAWFGDRFGGIWILTSWIGEFPAGSVIVSEKLPKIEPGLRVIVAVLICGEKERSLQRSVTTGALAWTSVVELEAEVA